MQIIIICLAFLSQPFNNTPVFLCSALVRFQNRILLSSHALVFPCAGLGHLSHAEEYLSQAQWTVLKTPECNHEIKSRLHRNVGLLYAAKGDYPESLNQLGNDVRNRVKMAV